MRDLRDREDEDEVEEQLERGRTLLPGEIQATQVTAHRKETTLQSW